MLPKIHIYHMDLDQAIKKKTEDEWWILFINLFFLESNVIENRTDCLTGKKL